MIDEARLKELKDDFGEQDFLDLVEAFLEETWEAVDALEAMVEADSKTRSDQFHLLKGCARNLGAAAFADRCETFEHDPDSFAHADYRVLRSDFQSVCDWFNAQVQSQDA